jgi:hypothetical protein
VADDRRDYSGAAGIVAALLAGIDRPWKVIGLIALMVVGGAGYLIWDQRTQIAQAMLVGRSKPHLDIPAFVKAVPGMIRETRAYGALLIEMRLADNVGQVRAGLDRDGNTWIPLEGPHALIAETTDVVLIVRFLSNDAVCFDVSAASPNVEGATAARRFGIRHICAIEVPPVAGVLVGAAMLCWQDPPDDVTEGQAKIVLEDAAMRFAVW